MKLIRARNVKSKEFRWNQIMNAAMKEFAQRPYQEITISQICNHLPFSRENLYKNYVKSKEEIFLIVLEKEFTLWVDSFLLSNNQTSDISPDEFAKIWANSLSKRKKLLSLLVILQTIIEKNVNLEQLTKFKKRISLSNGETDSYSFDHVSQIQPKITKPFHPISILFNSWYISLIKSNRITKKSQ